MNRRRPSVLTTLSVIAISAGIAFLLSTLLPADVQNAAENADGRYKISWFLIGRAYVVLGLTCVFAVIAIVLVTDLILPDDEESDTGDSDTTSQ